MQRQTEAQDGSLEYCSSHWDHRLLFGVHKPNPSNEAIVLVDDDPVHIIAKPPPLQVQKFVLVRLQMGQGNFRV